MDENTFWLRIWQSVGVVVCVVVVSWSSCVISGNYLIKQMADKGVPALEAACAISPANTGYCNIVSSKSK